MIGKMGKGKKGKGSTKYCGPKSMGKSKARPKGNNIGKK